MGQGASIEQLGTRASQGWAGRDDRFGSTVPYLNSANVQPLNFLGISIFSRRNFKFKFLPSEKPPEYSRKPSDLFDVMVAERSPDKSYREGGR